MRHNICIDCGALAPQAIAAKPNWLCAACAFIRDADDDRRDAERQDAALADLDHGQAHEDV